MRASALTLSLLLACGTSGETEQSEATDSGSSTSTTPSTTSTTGFLEPTPCASSSDCEAGVCAAPYDPGSPNPIGAAVCVPACLEADDGTRYCIDDASCCEVLVCGALGLCDEPAAETSDEGTTDESGTGTETGETGGTGGTGGTDETGTTGTTGN